MKGQIIIVEGNIGCGKTTFLKSMQKYITEVLQKKCEIYSEPINKDFLDMYIANRKKYAFPFQIVVSRERVCLLNLAFQRIQNEEIIILMDRGLQGDFIFASVQSYDGYLTDDEWLVYKSMYSNPELPNTKVIYLKTLPEVAYSRILERNISEEVKGYDLGYISKLHEFHEMHISAHKTFDWNAKMDLVDGYLPTDICREIYNNI